MTETAEKAMKALVHTGYSSVRVGEDCVVGSLPNPALASSWQKQSSCSCQKMSSSFVPTAALKLSSERVDELESPLKRELHNDPRQRASTTTARRRSTPTASRAPGAP
jgi:hypothetical protein